MKIALGKKVVASDPANRYDSLLHETWSNDVINQATRATNKLNNNIAPTMTADC